MRKYYWWDYARLPVLGLALWVVLAAIVVLSLDLQLSSRQLWVFLAPALLGLVSGSAIEYFVRRLGAVRTTSEAILREASSSVVVLSDMIYNQNNFRLQNLGDPVQRWVSQVLSEHYSVVPVANPDHAREKYCEYLRQAFDVCGPDSTWLGIHEDSVTFFSDKKHRRESGAYLSALKAHAGKKYRIFVESDKNSAELMDAAVVKEYLESDAGRNVFSFKIWRGEFNRLITRNVEVSDLALYGDRVMLEFDHGQRFIVFHAEDALINGMRKLLMEVRRDELRSGLTRIDENYLHWLAEKPQQLGGNSNPSEDFSAPDRAAP